MAGDPLAAASEFASPLKPSPQAVEDHYLIPKCAAGIDSGHVAHTEIATSEIIGDEGPDDHRSVRVERRFRTRFDLDRPSDVVVSCGGDGGISKQQALVVGIIRVKLHAPTVGGQFRRVECAPQDRLHLFA